MTGVHTSGGADEILARAHTGTRVMTLRGVTMRIVSVAANLLLIVLVSPAELGLLAVVRGTFTLLQYLAEPGIGKAMLRRSETPTHEEYAALSGMQIIGALIIVATGVLWSAPVLGFGAIDPHWHWWMLLTVSTMVSQAAGTGARVRLERSLAYERVAIADVLSVFTLNIGLIAFALAGQFAHGVYIMLAITTLASNALFWHFSPGPAPSMHIGRLRSIARQSTGFIASSTCAVIREQGTPVLIGSMFGLQVAGLYSFAERVAQLLNIAFDGFRRASVPAATRLANDLDGLKLLASRTLSGSVSLAAPLAVMAVCALPVLATRVPHWQPAIFLAQCHVVVYALYGVVAASLEPVAVATRGARASLAELATALVAGWSAFALLNALHMPNVVPYLACAVAVMYLTPLIALWITTPQTVRPCTDNTVLQIGAMSVLSLLIYALLRMMSVPIIVAPIVPALLIAAAVPRIRQLPSTLTVRLRRLCERA